MKIVYEEIVILFKIQTLIKIKYFLNSFQNV